MNPRKPMSIFQPDTTIEQRSQLNMVYEQALAKIAKLESELQQKDSVLEINFKEQAILRERLQACIKTIHETTSQLINVESDLKNHYKHIHQQVDDLQQQIRDLELANDAWSKRSISLEFEVLSVRQQNNAVKADYDLAIHKIAQLEKDLQAAKIENQRMKPI
jgi:chromosome segregation ATPase